MWLRLCFGVCVGCVGGQADGSKYDMRAILCAVGMATESKPNFTHLPLLLVKGSAANTQNLLAWLETQCVVHCTAFYYYESLELRESRRVDPN